MLPSSAAITVIRTKFSTKLIVLRGRDLQSTAVLGKKSDLGDVAGWHVGRRSRIPERYGPEADLANRQARGSVAPERVLDRVERDETIHSRLTALTAIIRPVNSDRIDRCARSIFRDSTGADTKRFSPFN
jgi:hypothetical protein